MKTNVLKCLAFIAATILSVPSFGQDYLKIYFHDGTTERHFLSLVQKITTTKYDSDGLLHQDYQMQQIIMADTTYSYPIAEIDSITYRKVEEEDIEKSYDEVIPFAGHFFAQCSTVEEMEQHLDEIRQHEKVDSVWRSGQAITIRFLDGFDVSFYYPVNTDNQYQLSSGDETGYTSIRLSGNISELNLVNNVYSSKKVVIANQQSRDTGRNDNTEQMFLPLKQEFESLGFVTDYEDCPDLDFFSQRIDDYDIVFLTTHGCYDGQKHWILTGEYIGETVFKNQEVHDMLKKNWDLNESHFDLDQLKYIFLPERRDKLIGDTVYACYVMISEEYLKSRPYRFNEGSIFFNVACESMKGEGQLTTSEGFTANGNSSLADILLGGGIDMYFGYNESNWGGQTSGSYLFQYMLQGCSEEKAFALLHDKLKHEGAKYYAHLIDYGQSALSNHSFIVRTYTQPVQANEAPYSNEKIAVTGFTSKLVSPRIDPGNVLRDVDIISGFRYGTSPSLSSYSQTEDCGLQFSNTEYGNCKFTAEIPVNPGQTIYYQAYTYDGINYNLGEICSFTAPEHSDAELLISERHNGKTYSISRTMDKSGDYRLNPDGTKFFPSYYSINAGGVSYDIPDVFYCNEDTSTPAVCATIDSGTGTIHFFAATKDAEYQYSMEGYVYEITRSGIQRSDVFNYANFGWMPYFSILDDKLVLYFFSFAGYFSIICTESSPYVWDMYYWEDIYPDDFRNLMFENDRFLVY